MTPHKETTEVRMTVIPKDKWKQKMAAIRRKSDRFVSKHRRLGGRFKVTALYPNSLCGGDSVQMAAVILNLDWKIAIKMDIVQSARDIITKLNLIRALDPAFTSILASVIEEKGLYEHNIGEFFLLYGRFEEKYSLSKGGITRKKMETLIRGDRNLLKEYAEGGKKRLVPLPYAVRNILSHIGNNPNTLDPERKELKKAITLLKSWVE